MALDAKTTPSRIVQLARFVQDCLRLVRHPVTSVHRAESPAKGRVGR